MMDPNAARHAVLMFVFVFGGAAILFAGIIANSRMEYPEPYFPRGYFLARLVGALIGLAVGVFGFAVFAYW